MKPSIRTLLYLSLFALSSQLVACGGSDSDSSTSSDSSSTDSSDSSSDSGDESATTSVTLTPALSPNPLSSEGQGVITITADTVPSSDTVVSATESDNLLTFSDSTCTISTSATSCTISVTAASVDDDTTKSGTVTFSTDNSDASISSLSFSIEGDSSSSSNDSETSTPFVMAYYPNYAGYDNNNTSSSEVSSEDPCKDAGYYIAQASYNVPGIEEEGNYVGYPACNKGSNSSANNGTTENQHFEDMLEGLTAVNYGFFLPESDGTFTFNDPWTDQKLTDYDTGGLCDTSKEGSEVCYYDSTQGTSGTAAELTRTDGYENCWEYVCYGAFSAFTDLQNEAGTLKHYIAIGGWTYLSYMDRLVSSNGTSISSTNIENFLKVAKHLKANGVDGIDLDIEFNDPATDYASSLLFQALADNATNNANGQSLVEQIKDLGLEVSITIQATPGMLQGLMGNDGSDSSYNYIQSWFDQGLDHFNLMTYDFHGNFDYGTDNYTGFNSNLFSYNSGTYSDPFALYTDPVTGEDADFSIDGSLKYLNAGNDAESLSSWNRLSSTDLLKVNIGLAAYGRAYSGVTIDTDMDPDSTGLYQSISNAAILPGDQDSATCSTDPSSSDACNGMFSYNYLLNDMLTNGFTAKDWTYYDSVTQETYAIGSTMFKASAFTPTTSSTVYDTVNNVTAVAPSSAYPSSVTNSFVAYTSANVAKSYGTYAKKKGLGGVIMWTINGDVSYKEDQSNSLIYNFEQGYNSAN
ncbi:glycoside hydrolase family 18 protein [uncultured Shewanella sp.]|uniref:glycosyl hydrolase family 18 protein n=1 Tax=uncultured Shewanella sp. TaxID=173975 RepID=UPI0026365716|nr:glycoside hydrolase family 18 protein [uncultured Shewanella sp.]